LPKGCGETLPFSLGSRFSWNTQAGKKLGTPLKTAPLTAQVFVSKLVALKSVPFPKTPVFRRKSLFANARFPKTLVV
jgi:hypothetical protein